MFPHEHGSNDIRLLWCLSLAFVHYIEQLLLYLSSYAVSITGEIYLEVKKTFSYRTFQSSVLYLNVPISWTQNRSQTYVSGISPSCLSPRSTHDPAHTNAPTYPKRLGRTQNPTAVFLCTVGNRWRNSQVSSLIPSCLGCLMPAACPTPEVATECVQATSVYKIACDGAPRERIFI